MNDSQSYENRVNRLAAARRKDTAERRSAVLTALTQLRREDRRVSRRTVTARAGVHRNFLQRHKDLAALIDEAAGGQRSEQRLAPADRITAESLKTELAAARHRNQQLERKVGVLERRLGAHEPSLGPDLVDHHPVVIELRRRLAELEQQAVEKSRALASLQDDVDVLRETNRSLVREYGLQGSGN